MKKKDRNRLKEVVYEAYMAGHARGGKTEEIVEALAEKFYVCPRTIQRWIYDVRKRRQAIKQQLLETVRTNIMQLRHESGLPSTYTYIDENGHYHMEF